MASRMMNGIGRCSYNGIFCMIEGLAVPVITTNIRKEAQTSCERGSEYRDRDPGSQELSILL